MAVNKYDNQLPSRFANPMETAEENLGSIGTVVNTKGRIIPLAHGFLNEKMVVEVKLPHMVKNMFVSVDARQYDDKLCIHYNGQEWEEFKAENAYQESPEAIKLADMFVRDRDIISKKKKTHFNTAARNRKLFNWFTILGIVAIVTVGFLLLHFVIPNVPFSDFPLNGKDIFRNILLFPATLGIAGFLIFVPIQSFGNRLRQEVPDPIRDEVGSELAYAVSEYIFNKEGVSAIENMNWRSSHFGSNFIYNPRCEEYNIKIAGHKDGRIAGTTEKVTYRMYARAINGNQVVSLVKDGARI